MKVYTFFSLVTSKPSSCPCTMSITVEFRLLSGKTAPVHADLAEDVAALQFRAQKALGVGLARLVDSFGNVLDVCARIHCVGVHHGTR